MGEPKVLQENKMTIKRLIEAQMAVLELGNQLSKFEWDDYIQWLYQAENAAPTLDQNVHTVTRRSMKSMRLLAEAVQEVRLRYIDATEDAQKALEARSLPALKDEPTQS